MKSTLHITPGVQQFIAKNGASAQTLFAHVLGDGRIREAGSNMLMIDVDTRKDRDTGDCITTIKARVAINDAPVFQHSLITDLKVGKQQFLYQSGVMYLPQEH